MNTTRAHVSAEWADLRPSLDKVALQARALIAALRDIPRPLYADERRAADKARLAFAEQVKDGLADLLGDLTGPLWRRAEDAGIDPDAAFTLDLADLLSEYDALERESNQVCVTARELRAVADPGPNNSTSTEELSHAV